MNSAAAYALPQTKSLGDYLDIIRRHFSAALLVFIVILAASIVIALVWPPTYRSTATILIEQQEIPVDLVRSTVSTYVDQRIQIIQQRVMTRSNLMEIIKKYDLYAKERRREPMEVVIDGMRDDIELKTISADVVDPRNGQQTRATIAFTLSYKNESPQLAQKVANELTSLFLNENLSSRRELAAQASDFLTSESDRVSAHISDLERRLAEFKEKNVNRMPELTQFNMQLADRADREITDVEQELRSLRDRRIYLESQLAQINPKGALYSESGERILGPVERLKTLRAKYISLSAIYASNHPDLIRMRREIASLEAEVGHSGSTTKELEASLTSTRGELAENRKRYGENHPTVQRLERQVAALEEALARQRKPQAAVATTKDADNPAYIQVQSQLQRVKAQILSQKKKKSDLEAKLRDLEGRIADTPTVEQEYRELTRDYDNAWTEYKELKAKQTEAKLAQSMEAESKGERFTLIDPPLLPEEPASPNRLAISLLGAVVSLAGGVGTVAAKEGLDGTVRGIRGVTSSIEMVPLAGIPYIETDEERRRRKLIRIAIISSILAVLAIAVALAHFLYMPLDVLWYAAQRRLGLLGPI